jgi:phospholipid transport system substrate-binding protein
MKKIVLVFLAIFALASSINYATAASAEAQSPTAMLQGIADHMINNLKANKATLKNNPTYVYDLADKTIVPHADLIEMSRRVLPAKTWNSATQAQRNKFRTEFTTLLVRTYASALAEYKDQDITFYPIRGGYANKSRVTVDSKIVRSDGPAISVRYQLVLKGQEWRLYDLTIEGISMLDSFRSQFADKLAQGDMVELIKELGQHNANNSGVN